MYPLWYLKKASNKHKYSLLHCHSPMIIDASYLYCITTAQDKEVAFLFGLAEMVSGNLKENKLLTRSDIETVRQMEVKENDSNN